MSRGDRRGLLAVGAALGVLLLTHFFLTATGRPVTGLLSLYCFFVGALVVADANRGAEGNGSSQPAGPYRSALVPAPRRFFAWLVSFLILLVVFFLLAGAVLGRVFSSRQLDISPGTVSLLGLALATVAALGILGVILFSAAILIVNLDYWNLIESPAGAQTSDAPSASGQSSGAQAGSTQAGSTQAGSTQAGSTQAGSTQAGSTQPRGDQSGRSERALWRAILILLGLAQATVIIDDGKMRLPDGSEVSGFAGPGFLDVRTNQAAVIETAGAVSDVVPPGRVWLDGHQRVTGVSDLGIQFARVSVANLPTRDGMLIERFDFVIVYRFGHVRGLDPTMPPRHNTDLIRRKLWDETPASYRRTVSTVAESNARAVIGNCVLSELVQLPLAKRQALSKEIANRVEGILRECEILSVNIGQVVIPEAARQQLESRWTAEKERETALIRAAAAKALLVMQGEGQAEALLEVEKVKDRVRQNLITQLATFIYGADKGPTVNAADAALAQRYLAAIEVLTAYLAQDSNQATRLVEVLEHIARNSSGVNLFVNLDDMSRRRDGLGPGMLNWMPNGGGPSSPASHSEPTTGPKPAG